MIEFTEGQTRVIRRAIELVRLYEPNPLIRPTHRCCYTCCR